MPLVILLTVAFSLAAIPGYAEPLSKEPIPAADPSDKLPETQGNEAVANKRKPKPKNDTASDDYLVIILKDASVVGGQ